MRQEGGEKWTAAANLQPTFPKSDRLVEQKSNTSAQIDPVPAAVTAVAAVAAVTAVAALARAGQHGKAVGAATAALTADVRRQPQRPPPAGTAL